MGTRRTRSAVSVLATAVLITALNGGSGAQDAYLSIEKGFGEKIVVALPLFEGVGGTVDADNIRDVLTFDLSTSGHFVAVENIEFVDETETDDRLSGRIAFPEWLALGAEVLVKGSFESGLSQFSVEATVYDVGAGRTILGKRYSGEASQWRSAVHHISNDIIEAITGEPGIALSKIAFVSNATGTKEVYVMDYDGANRRRITKDSLDAMYPDWFPDGRRIAYTRFNGRRQESCAVDVRTGATTRLTSFPGLNAFVAASASGDDIAMSLSRDGNPEIYRLAPDGSRPTRLTFGRSTESSPCWSPDGRRMAFLSDRSGSPQIYVMNSTGGTAERLTYRGNYNTSPDWSPKGDLIAYISRIDGVFQVCTVDVETKEVVRLTTGWEDKEDPSWAPDGRHIVYSVKSGNRYDLYLLDIYELEPLRLTSGGGDFLSPAWSF